VEPPETEPIGLQLTRVAKVVSRAVDQALERADGSLPQWLVLVSVKRATHGAQRTIAESIGIEDATLTHHLNRMESAGLLTRRRDPRNRRVHLVELTEAGDARFISLLATVVAFDAQLRRDFSVRDLRLLGRLLDHMARNAVPQATRTSTTSATARSHVRPKG
jgi:MarR family transcriptional regulator, transcriptional regulator for hemolysin